MKVMDRVFAKLLRQCKGCASVAPPDQPDWDHEICMQRAHFLSVKSWSERNTRAFYPRYTASDMEGIPDRYIWNRVRSLHDCKKMVKDMSESEVRLSGKSTQVRQSSNTFSHYRPKKPST